MQSKKSGPLSLALSVEIAPGMAFLSSRSSMLFSDPEIQKR